MKISIIIVSYNAPKHLDICLDSCQQAIKNVDGEIIVVDNNSSEIDFEELKSLFPNIKFLLQKLSMRMETFSIIFLKLFPIMEFFLQAQFLLLPFQIYYSFLLILKSRFFLIQ